MRKIISIIVLLYLSVCAMSQIDVDNTPFLIKVEGEFITKQKPENIVVHLNINEEDLKYKKCFEKAFDTRIKIKKAFIDNGINPNAIKVMDISIREKYSYESNNQKDLGYKAVIQMNIEERYSEGFAEKLINSLQDYTFAVDYYISFALSESQKKLLRQEAIKGAIQDATQKAKLIAESANISLGKIHKISYGSSWSWNSHNYGDDDIVMENELEYLANTAPSQRTGDVDFNPKEISIKKIVMMEWNIEQ